MIFFLGFSDGDLRQTLLLREVQDHQQQHERLHDQERAAADDLYVQRRLPESLGRNVSALHEFRVTLVLCKLMRGLDCVKI